MSPKKRTAGPPARSKIDYESQIVAHQVPVTVDFRGLDILSAMDYLKRLQTTLPPKTGREKRTDILNRRRNMPDIVLAHQIASLFPNMAGLEKETNFLVTEGRIIQLPLPDGDVAYMRREHYTAPQELLEIPSLTDLADDQVRRFSQAGYLLRRNDGLVLSTPNIGLYFQLLKAARKWVLSQLRKSIVLEKDLKVRYEAWKDGGIFQYENLIHDLVGSSRIELLMLVVGRAFRITKRGREDR